MDSNMKLSHLSFRNHCIFRSLNNFSSEGQFLRPINGGAIFLFFFSPPPPPSRLFHNYFFRSLGFGKFDTIDIIEIFNRGNRKLKSFSGKTSFSEISTLFERGKKRRRKVFSFLETFKKKGEFFLKFYLARNRFQPHEKGQN